MRASGPPASVPRDGWPRRKGGRPGRPGFGQPGGKPARSCPSSRPSSRRGWMSWSPRTARPWCATTGWMVNRRDTVIEVAAELETSKFRAAQRVRRAVTLLLGPQAVPPELGGRARVPCAVCGSPVELRRAWPARRGRTRAGLRAGPSSRGAVFGRAARRTTRRRASGRACRSSSARAVRMRTSCGRLPPRPSTCCQSRSAAWCGPTTAWTGHPCARIRQLGPRFGVSGTHAGDLVRAGVARLLAAQQTDGG